MDDSTFQIAVSLRLGLAFCKPHSCHHCGCEVTAFATHGLRCVKSQGRYHRHSSLNDIIHDLNPVESLVLMVRDQMVYLSSMEMWKTSRMGCNSVDTYAPSYSRVASQEAGAVET